MKSRRLIRPLFDGTNSEVKSVSTGRIRAVYRFVSDSEMGSDVPFQVGFFVSKRVGGAVVRNRIRRQLREAYRLRHRDLIAGLSSQPDWLSLGIVYRGAADAAWQDVRHDLDAVIDALLEQVTKTPESRPATG